MENFEPALPLLQDELPAWWAKQGGELEKVLRVFASEIDALSLVFDQIEADANVLTASTEALREEYAYVLDMPLTGEEAVDRALLQWALNEDGSVEDLIDGLELLVTPPDEPVVEIPELEFPEDPGQALVFPGDGSPLYFGFGRYFTVTVSHATRQWEVIGRAALTFDRAAAQRLIDRSRPAHLLPATYSEI